MKMYIYYTLLISSLLMPLGKALGLDLSQNMYSQGECYFVDTLHVVRVGVPEDKKYVIALSREIGDSTKSATSKLYVLITLNEGQSEDYWKSDLKTFVSNFDEGWDKRNANHPFRVRCEGKETLFSRVWYTLFDDKGSLEASLKDCLADWNKLYEDLQTIGVVTFTKEPPIELVEAQRVFSDILNTAQEKVASLAETAKILPPSSASFSSIDYGNGSLAIEFLKKENSTATAL